LGGYSRPHFEGGALKGEEECILGDIRCHIFRVGQIKGRVEECLFVGVDLFLKSFEK